MKCFARKYTADDILLLAEMDERHDTTSGPAVKKLCERVCVVFGETGYERLALISVAHLYNLRKSIACTRRRSFFTKPPPRRSITGERRKPQPNGQPGYIRIDSVHQGDLDKQKGVYHINTVDEVTQYEVVCAVETISEISLSHLNPYINYHRPSFFPETITDGKDRQRKVYRYENMMTPYDKLKSLPDARNYLKAGLSFEILDKVAHQVSDNQAADHLQKARQKLFNTINGQDWKTFRSNPFFR